MNFGCMIAAILYFASFSASAQTAIGNGGDAVVCRDAGGQIRSIELLDYWEGRERFGFTYDFGSVGMSAEQTAEFLIRRLEFVDPERFERYSNLIREFESNAFFWPGVQLEDVSDSQHLGFPNGCHVEQLAIQRDPQFPEEKRYTVAKDLWDQLNAINRAGLILHELLLFEATHADGDWRHRNSISTRYLNATIARAGFGDWGAKRYLDLLESTLFKQPEFMDIDGWYVRCGSYCYLDFFPSGKLQSGLLARTREWTQANIAFSTEGRFSLYENGLLESAGIHGVYDIPFGNGTVRIKDSVRFTEAGDFAGGKLAEAHSFLQIEHCMITLPEDALFTVTNEGNRLTGWGSNGLRDFCYLDPLSGQILELHAINSSFPEATFYDTGTPETVRIYSSGFDPTDRFSLAVAGKKILFDFSSIIKFHRNGFVKGGVISEDSVLLTSANDLRQFRRLAYLQFDESGRVDVNAE